MYERRGRGLAEEDRDFAAALCGVLRVLSLHSFRGYRCQVLLSSRQTQGTSTNENPSYKSLHQPAVRVLLVCGENYGFWLLNAFQNQGKETRKLKRKLQTFST